MVVAAYLVGGFLIASVYAVGHAARAPRPLPPARVPHRRSPSRPSPPRCRWASATAGALGLQQPAGQVRRHRDGARRPAATCPRPCSATSTRPAQVAGGIPIPGLASLLSDPSDRHGDGRAGPQHGPGRRPADHRGGQRRPPGVGHHGRPRHAAVPADAVVLGVVDLPTTTCPGAEWFLRAAVAAGVLVGGHAGGGLDRQRGRPSALDRLQEDEGRGRRDRQHRASGSPSSASWSSTSGSGVTTILVLRGMSRRFRARPTSSTRPTSPYGPREPVADEPEVPVR